MNRMSSLLRSRLFRPLPNLKFQKKLLWTSTGLIGFGSIVLGTTTKVEAKEQYPEYTRDEVAKHNKKETRIWMTYKDGVYDVTDFIPSHPGGPEKISLAAGGAVDPYWSLFQQHYHAEVQKILAKYKIGTLKQSDQDDSVDETDPYASDPKRHPGLIVHQQKPFNAETPTALVTDRFITPTDLWYVRHHLPVPDVDPQKYKLFAKIDGKTGDLAFSIDELKKKFKSTEIVATLLCTGLRRSEFNEVATTAGLPWSVGAIGTAKFKGILLRDFLLSLGLNESELGKFRHVQFIGYDDPYDASIPMHKALSPTGDVLLAYEMNDEKLTRDHGFPLRVVVPGHAGARNVKWLSQIVLSENESVSPWQSGPAYKGFGPNVTSYDGIDVKKVASVQEYPVISAITSPLPNSPIQIDSKENKMILSGYAWSGGGRGINRVDVSSDGGKTWHQAKLTKLDQAPYREWAWTLWKAEVPAPQTSSTQLICKAVDTSYNAQPDSVVGLWNARGILNNAWHRVNVQLDRTKS